MRHPPFSTLARSRLGFWSGLCFAVAFSLRLQADTPPRRYLFLDPGLLQSSSGLELKVNPAKREETVIRPDRPWETLMISFYLTVRQEGGKLRMWYICRDRQNRANLAYAESTDGRQWTKPNLGIVEYAGSRDNNLVGISSLEGVVFRDPQATEAERYGYITSVYPHGIFRYFSPDGLHWQRDAQPLLLFNSDTQNDTFWDERLKCYVLYLRGWEPGSVSTRTRKVVRTTTESIRSPLPVHPSGRPNYDSKPGKPTLPWIVDELPTVLQCDAGDPPKTDIYDIAAQPYPLDPSWYVGFPAFFRHLPETAYQGRVETQFVGSRDGIKWERYDRAAYVEPGLADSESRNMVFMGTGMIVHGDEIWQYGTGFRSLHGDMAARRLRTDGVIYRYVQRIDGFVSLDSGNGEGRARTLPVKVTGDKLILNVDTRAVGELRAGFVGADGQPIPGFALEACDPLHTNSTGAVVQWGGKSDLAALAGQEVSVEFSSRWTRLFSFRFE